MSIGFLGTILAKLLAVKTTVDGNLDAKVSDTATASSLTTVDNNVSAIKSDTDAYLDASVSSRATASALQAVDDNVDAIKTKTDAYLDSKVSEAKLELKYQEFSSSGTWTRPSGVNFVNVLLVGAGGGGGGGCVESGHTGMGGAGGGGMIIYRERVPVSSDLTITIGTGGTGGAYTFSHTAPNDGTDGGNSTITGSPSIKVTALGGKGGDGGDGEAVDGGAGGGRTSINSNYIVTDAYSCVAILGGNGGYPTDYSTTKGECVPGFSNGSYTSCGGGGSYGNGGAGGSSTSAAGNGAKGGGGGGGYHTTDYGNGGDGGNGYCIITWEE